MKKIERTLKELIKLDAYLRKFNFSIVCEKWDEANPYFSIGEGNDNRHLYTGKTCRKEKFPKRCEIKKNDLERKFCIACIKDESGENEVIYELSVKND